MPTTIYGKNTIKEALEAGQPINKLFIVRGNKSPADRNIIQMGRQRGIPIKETDTRKLSELAGQNRHQGIVAILTTVAYAEIDDIFKRAKEKNEPALIAILDEIQDPHNLGAIIRSAEAFGFHGIIIPKDRSVGLTDTVAKTSAGAVAHLPIVRVSNLARILDDLKNEGVWIAGADQDAEMAFYKMDLNRSLGVVIGGEGKGIRRLIKKKCDFLVRIPLFGNVNSLNASVAAALVFCEARKQRTL